MRPSVRSGILAAALALALAACGEAPTPAPSETAPAPAAEQATSLGERYVNLLPQWIPIANTADGGSVAYDLKGAKAAQAEGRNEVTLQVRHATPSQWRLAEEGGERLISYQLEHVVMRFDCTRETFQVLERRVLESDGAVIERLATPDAPAQLVADNGLALIARDPACARRG